MIWTIYRNNVYNITNFVNSHPGGNIILQAGGKNLEMYGKNMVWNGIMEMIE